MSRAVVIGPYPPTGDPAGAETLAAVRTLRAHGHDVVVVSPAPSAARVHARRDTLLGAARIARLLRGADVAIVVGSDPRVHRRDVDGTTWTDRVLAAALEGVQSVQIVAPAQVPQAMARAGAHDRATNGARYVRAGLPTLVRTLAARVRQSVRRGRRSPGAAA